MDANADQTAELRCWAELRLAARIDSTQVAKLLGFAEHDVPVLTSVGLLKPLGNPAPNATKWFSTIEIIRLVWDRQWLEKATKRISQYWMNKRSKAKANRSNAVVGVNDQKSQASQT